MAYGAIMGKKGKKGMTPQIIVTPTVTFTSVTATSSSGVIYTGVFADGVWTISVKEFGEYTVNAQGDSPATATVDVVVCQQYELTMGYDPILNNNTWAEISEASQGNMASSLWSIGDTKGVDLTWSGIITGTYYFYIIGFNHNESIEGIGTHFLFGKTAQTEGIDVSMVTGNYSTHYTPRTFVMNSSGGSAGGWASSYMRGSVCPTFYNSILPSDLQAVIIECPKYTDNVGSGSTSPSAVTMTQDKIWLLAQYEVIGSVAAVNNTEANYQQQYQYYIAGNPAFKMQATDTAQYGHWWTRSQATNTTGGFRIITYPASANTYNGYYNWGFAPAFKV